MSLSVHPHSACFTKHRSFFTWKASDFSFYHCLLGNYRQYSIGEITKGVLPLILQYYHPNLGASMSSTISEHYLAGALKLYMPAKDCGALN